ncbi:MAG TPA: nitrophenyl compound nitroreductase subunit ArsF family protein [Methanospirillum sp.]|uniref:nitrophenyl compound nitroreductase subunit ArsF family protein n=1 Tax=Methanospirillum sp. TaxID=45200 RepID=UPI002C318F7B|nr:nitrophenyl compound nitroreductase subunit ArsF family protein [Methanospirillum sp.]HPY61372.1 nitrophenyl compound nitroreductase subunit ArsF family protein [Methanospirillum sp.]
MIQSVLRVLSLRSIAVTLIICVICGAFISCAAAETNVTPSGVTQVEVYHFHPNQGCRTCTTIGEYAEELVKKSYPAELESKNMVFDHINFQDQKNADLVRKFEVTGSSLMIGVTDPSGFHKEEDIKVWYKVGNKDEFMTYLKDLLDKRLAGNLE